MQQPTKIGRSISPTTTMPLEKNRVNIMLICGIDLTLGRPLQREMEGSKVEGLLYTILLPICKLTQ